MEKRTKFDTPPTDTPLDSKMSKLPTVAFEHSIRRRSLPFQEIASTVQKTTYYSPSASNVTVRDADHPFVRDLKKLDNFNAAPDAWLAELLQTSHLLCFHVDALDDDGVFNLALGYFEGSACACWPGRLVTVNGADANASFFQPDLAIDQPTFRAIVAVDTVTACSLVWRSPLWQHRRFPLTKKLPAACRLFLVGKPSPLLAVVADEAGWSLDMSTMQALSFWVPDFPRDLVTDDLPLFVFTFIKVVLKCTDVEALARLQKRLGYNDMAAFFTSELLDLDEALEVMDGPDIKMIHDDQDAARRSRGSRASFLRDYRAVAASVKAKAAPPPVAKGKGKGKGGKAGKPPPRVPINASIPHDQAATLMPPGASIWQSRKNYSWCVHVPPRPRISEPWGLDTQKSLVRIAYRAWVLYLDLNSMDWPDCPHVFPDWCK